MRLDGAIEVGFFGGGGGELPFVHEVALYPIDDFGAQPYYILGWVVPSCGLS